MAQISEVRKQGIGNAAVSLTVTHVDNEVTIALNGVGIATLNGPPGFDTFQENLTDKVVADKPNVLVFTLVNFAPDGFNPAACSATLNVGDEEINLSTTSGDQSAPQGLFSQIVVVLQR